MSNGKEDILYVGDSFIDAKTVEHAQVSFAGVFPLVRPFPNVEASSPLFNFQIL